MRRRHRVRSQDALFRMVQVAFAGINFPELETILNPRITLVEVIRLHFRVPGVAGGGDRLQANAEVSLQREMGCPPTQKANVQ